MPSLGHEQKVVLGFQNLFVTNPGAGSHGEDERDTELKSKFLQPDAKAVIFKWLIDGYINYHIRGLQEPKSVKESIRSYEKKND